MSYTTNGVLMEHELGRKKRQATWNGGVDSLKNYKMITARWEGVILGNTRREMRVFD